MQTKFHSKMKHFLHRCDRAMIYIFIASSYFPWLTVGTLSCWMLQELRWVIWLFAVLGITYQQIFHERYKMLELLLYLVMGLGPAAIIVTSNVRPLLSKHVVFSACTCFCNGTDNRHSFFGFCFSYFYFYHSVVSV